MNRLIPPLAIGAALLVGACGSSNASNNAAASKTSPSASNSTTSPAASSAPQTGNPSAPVTLNESGSTLLEPFLQELVSPLKSAYPNVELAPSGGGSGKGISDAASGVTQIGGSDAYLSSGQMTQYQGLMNIPVAISSQAINYNLPGVATGLKLNGNVIAQIYEGKITKWNDSSIAALNPGVSLPSTTIVPVRRIDASGDTFIFTSFLTKTNQTWANGPAFGTTVTWPSAASNELTANGNPGMVQTCKATPGCIAYIGISSEDAAQQAGLGEVMLQNAAGNYVEPSQATAAAAVSNGANNVPANLAAPLIYEPGAQSYPIVNFEYIMVKASQSDANTALAIRDFLTWTISTTGGSQSQYLAAEHFIALPSNVVPKVTAAIAQIKG